MKDCLICWFCERAGDLLTVPFESLRIAQPQDDVGFPRISFDDLENPSNFRDAVFTWDF
jgi:hypothetical protein